MSRRGLNRNVLENPTGTFQSDGNTTEMAMAKLPAATDATRSQKIRYYATYFAAVFGVTTEVLYAYFTFLTTRAGIKILEDLFETHHHSVGSTPSPDDFGNFMVSTTPSSAHTISAHAFNDGAPLSFASWVAIVLTLGDFITNICLVSPGDDTLCALGLKKVDGKLKKADVPDDHLDEQKRSFRDQALEYAISSPKIALAAVTLFSFATGACADVIALENLFGDSPAAIAAMTAVAAGGFAYYFALSFNDVMTYGTQFVTKFNETSVKQLFSRATMKGMHATFAAAAMVIVRSISFAWIGDDLNRKVLGTLMPNEAAKLSSGLSQFFVALLTRVPASFAPYATTATAVASTRVVRSALKSINESLKDLQNELATIEVDKIAARAALAEIEEAKESLSSLEIDKKEKTEAASQLASEAANDPSKLTDATQAAEIAATARETFEHAKSELAALTEKHAPLLTPGTSTLDANTGARPSTTATDISEILHTLSLTTRTLEERQNTAPANRLVTIARQLETIADRLFVSNAQLTTPDAGMAKAQYRCDEYRTQLKAIVNLQEAEQALEATQADEPLRQTRQANVDFAKSEIAQSQQQSMRRVIKELNSRITQSTSASEITALSIERAQACVYSAELTVHALCHDIDANEALIKGTRNGNTSEIEAKINTLHIKLANAYHDVIIAKSKLAAYEHAHCEKIIVDNTPSTDLADQEAGITEQQHETLARASAQQTDLRNASIHWSSRLGQIRHIALASSHNGSINEGMRGERDGENIGLLASSDESAPNKKIIFESISPTQLDNLKRLAECQAHNLTLAECESLHAGDPNTLPTKLIVLAEALKTAANHLTLGDEGNFIKAIAIARTAIETITTNLNESPVVYAANHPSAISWTTFLSNLVQSGLFGASRGALIGYFCLSMLQQAGAPLHLILLATIAITGPLAFMTARAEYTHLRNSAIDRRSRELMASYMNTHQNAGEKPILPSTAMLNFSIGTVTNTLSQMCRGTQGVTFFVGILSPLVGVEAAIVIALCLQVEVGVVQFKYFAEKIEKNANDINHTARYMVGKLLKHCRVSRFAKGNRAAAEILDAAAEGFDPDDHLLGGTLGGSPRRPHRNGQPNTNTPIADNLFSPSGGQVPGYGGVHSSYHSSGGAGAAAGTPVADGAFSPASHAPASGVAADGTTPMFVLSPEGGADAAASGVAAGGATPMLALSPEQQSETTRNGTSSAGGVTLFNTTAERQVHSDPGSASACAARDQQARSEWWKTAIPASSSQGNARPSTPVRAILFDNLGESAGPNSQLSTRSFGKTGGATSV